MRDEAGANRIAVSAFQYWLKRRFNTPGVCPIDPQTGSDEGGP